MASLPSNTDDYPICTACGTQFPPSRPSNPTLTTCRICNDPRQFTPPTGQSFTTLSTLRSTGHHNIFTPYGPDPRLISIHTEPKVGIGQRCILIRSDLPGNTTTDGNSSSGGGSGGIVNILWDCITLLDAPTVAYINSLGGLGAIVISHPHYYSSHLLWARTFECPVYLAPEDADWLVQWDPKRQIFLNGGETEQYIVAVVNGRPAPTEVLAIKLGGHFPGSMVLLIPPPLDDDGYEIQGGKDKLLIADTLVTTPAGMGRWPEGKRPEGMNTFVFMWSIPNMIPLPPNELGRMWAILGQHDFGSTHGAFVGQDIEDPDIKKRVLASMQIQVRGMGWTNHPLLRLSAA